MTVVDGPDLGLPQLFTPAQAAEIAPGAAASRLPIAGSVMAERIFVHVLMKGRSPGLLAPAASELSQAPDRDVPAASILRARAVAAFPADVD